MQIISLQMDPAMIERLNTAAYVIEAETGRRVSRSEVIRRCLDQVLPDPSRPAVRVRTPRPAST